LQDSSDPTPLSQIVSHETERITPSYVKIPTTYPKLSCSGRTGLDRSVLNDTFVNVITGSEDFSFKLMRKNQYEEALFRCEDDRYEFEMCIECNASSIRIMKPLAVKIQAMNTEERHIFRVEDCNFTPVHYKAVDTLYGDQGAMMIELLKRSPAFAIPVILPRMEAKDVEWRKVREEMSKIWKKIYQVRSLLSCHVM
jgi:paired amphipathic helix protein Sin3a